MSAITTAAKREQDRKIQKQFLDIPGFYAFKRKLTLILSHMRHYSVLTAKLAKAAESYAKRKKEYEDQLNEARKSLISTAQEAYPFANEYRAALTGPEIRSALLPGITLSWRRAPRRVLVKDSAKALEELEALRLERFIRRSAEPNVIAMMGELDAIEELIKEGKLTALEVTAADAEFFLIQPDGSKVFLRRNYLGEWTIETPRSREHSPG